MTEKELIVKELKSEIEKEEKIVDNLSTKILAAYQCANMYPLRGNAFRSDAERFRKQQDTVKQKIEWKRSVLSKYKCY